MLPVTVTCARTRAGRDSPLRALDEEIIRKVVDMVREKTGVQRWRYIQVLSCALVGVQCWRGFGV